MFQSVLEEFGAGRAELVAGAVAAVAIYVGVIVATRAAGLRSFSKMSSFDFAMTVAIGSLIAAAASGQAPLATTAVGVVVLYVTQFVVALLRRGRTLHGMIDNEPLLLMDGDEILHENLQIARLNLDDLHGKLREANVLDYTQVRAVVLETTGDVSVMHGSGTFDTDLLRGVRR